MSLPLLEAAAAASSGDGVNQSDDVRGFPTPPPPQFKLELFQVLWRCLHKCWQDGVFVLALIHRFWKLTLQVTFILTVTCIHVHVYQNNIIVMTLSICLLLILGMDGESYFISFLKWW